MRFPALTLLIVAMAACASTRHASSPVGSSYDLPAFARALDSLRTAARIPGLSAAVVKDGKVIFARGFGYADLDRRIAATPETPYDIASVTKPLSAVVALRLAEEGRLDLDRPMAQYSEWEGFCKDFSEQPSILARGLRCESPQHSLRHLLTHTALGDPGTQFFYNPILYSWASRPMMSVVAGTSFSRLVEQYVFQPAGMARSARTYRGLPIRADLAAAMAIPYHADSNGAMVRSPARGAQGDGAAGGVISTVLDLARFDVALEQGKLISPASYSVMMRPMQHAGEPLPYSIGWFAQRYAGHELRWHSGWWDDAYSALYLKVLDENLTLILLANSEGVWWDNPNSSAQVERSTFARAFFRAFLPNRPPR